MPTGHPDPILSGLNDPQREAVTYGDGPLLVFAGAGSGKTRVLTHRVAYLIRRVGLAPRQLLAVTFTNKAANEMKERIYRLVGGLGRDLWMGTFHGLCARMLRYDGTQVGVPAAFTIFDEDDQVVLAKDCLKELGIDSDRFPPGQVLAEISRAKNELLGPRRYQEDAASKYHQVVGQVYGLYQRKLAENQALDFDDLIMRAVELLEVPEVQARYRERFHHVLVDEYQDINHAQYRLVRLLADGRRNLCVVGDDDQSIYGWRGAEMRIILQFEHDYPDAKVVKLEENYRSTSPILEVAWSVIRNNRQRKDKKLWTARSGGARPQCYQAPDEHEEAAYLASHIEQAVRRGERRCGDFAVLYRVNAQSRVLEKVLLGMGIPYRMVGGVQFYARAEIRDILAYLRVINNPQDSVSLRRIANVPPRGIGATTITKLMATAAERNLSLFQVMAHAEHLDLPTRTAQAVATLVNMLGSLMAERDSLTVTELTEAVIEGSGYRQWLGADQSVRNRTRLENVNELLSATREFENNAEQKTLAAFLEQVALISDVDKLKAGEDAVVLMTMHAAKGLEFPVVFMTGMEEGVFPLNRAIWEADPKELEEERRLCYVGITRAQDELFFTWATTRQLYGMTQRSEMTRFLRDLPDELVEGKAYQHSPRTITWHQADSHPSRLAQEIVSAASPTAPYHAGQKVRHHRFGTGIVINCEGEGDDAKVTVAFAGQGVKVLVAGYAKLTRI